MVPQEKEDPLDGGELLISVWGSIPRPHIKEGG